VTDMFTIVVASLLGMAILLYLVSRILRRNPSINTEEFNSVIKSEFARAKRLNRSVAMIEVEFEAKRKIDLINLLTIDRLLIRDYDHVSLISPDKYLILWPDNQTNIEASVVKNHIVSRLSGVRGIKHIGVAIFPNQGEDFDQLIKIAEAK